MYPLIIERILSISKCIYFILFKNIIFFTQYRITIYYQVVKFIKRMRAYGY